MPGAIEGATHVLSAPSDVAPDSPNRVLGLPVMAVEHEGLGTFLHSAWHPDADEVAAIVAGQPVVLMVRGPGHPVVMLGVQASNFDPSTAIEAPRNRIDVGQLAERIGALMLQDGVTFSFEQLNIFSQAIQAICYEQWNFEMAKSAIDELSISQGELLTEFDRIDDEHRRISYVRMDYGEDEFIVDGHLTTRQLEILVKVAKMRGER